MQKHLTMTITIPVKPNTGAQNRFEKYLTTRMFKWEKNSKNRFEPVYTVEVETAQEAFWLGMNTLAVFNRLFDGPLTKTLA